MSAPAMFAPVGDGSPASVVRMTAAGESSPCSRSAMSDPRWPLVADALVALSERGRRAVRVVDVDCGAGTLLLHIAHHARALGFVAVEGRGIDGAPALIGRARAAAARAIDPGIGVAFEVADVKTVLEEESEFPADILLWHGSRDGDRTDGMAYLLQRGGDRVIGDADARSCRT